MGVRSEGAGMRMARCRSEKTGRCCYDLSSNPDPMCFIAVNVVCFMVCVWLCVLVCGALKSSKPNTVQCKTQN